MAKTEFLQIRLSPQDRELIRQVAEASYLDISTWARQAIMQAASDFVGQSSAARLRVAESSRQPSTYKEGAETGKPPRPKRGKRS